MSATTESKPSLFPWILFGIFALSIDQYRQPAKTNVIEARFCLGRNQRRADVQRKNSEQNPREQTRFAFGRGAHEVLLPRNPTK